MEWEEQPLLGSLVAQAADWLPILGTQCCHHQQVACTPSGAKCGLYCLFYTLTPPNCTPPLQAQPQTAEGDDPGAGSPGMEEGAAGACPAPFDRSGVCWGGTRKTSWCSRPTWRPEPAVEEQASTPNLIMVWPHRWVLVCPGHWQWQEELNRGR